MDVASAYNYRLDWIASFVAVAHEGGFSAAAKSQYRSQPRISNHVGDLERALGTKLFDRSVHPTALTPEGRALLPHAEEILARIGLFADLSPEGSGAVRGDVRVGMYPSAAAFLYPPLVQRLRRDAPAVRAVLCEGDTLALEADLSEGDVDVVVRPLVPPVRDERLVHRQLWWEPLVAVVPTGHPLAARRSATLPDIATYPLVTIGEPTSGARQFETNLALAEAGTNPTIAFQTNQPQTLAALVRAGLGVGVTNSLAMATANCDGVELVPVTSTHVARRVAVWWRADRPSSAATELVRDTISSLPPPQATTR